MEVDAYAFALKNTLNEIRNLCPDVTGTLVFREDGEIVACDAALSQAVAMRVVDAFSGVLEKAETVGGVKNVVINGDEGRVSISRVEGVYMLVATSKKADVNYVNVVTRVLVPTVVRLLGKLCPTPPRGEPESELEDIAVKPRGELQPLIEKPAGEERAEEKPIEMAAAEEKAEKPEAESKASSPKPIVVELTVDNLGGLSARALGFFVSSDTVFVDSKILSRWSELCRGAEISEIEIATSGGKSSRFKVKPIKDSRYDGSGVIQMPEKIQASLEVKKGWLVKAKPIVK